MKKAEAASADRLRPDDLQAELERFREELRSAGLRESTVHSYLMGSTLFVRWLAGDYAPGPGRSGRPADGDGARLMAR